MWWSAEKRAEGLEYMHPKPSSHSGRIVGNPYLTRPARDRRPLPRVEPSDSGREVRPRPELSKEVNV